MPEVIAFDVNETLSDMTRLVSRFEDVGASRDLAPAWFAAALRDGIALAAAGGYAPFIEVAAGALRPLLAKVGALRLELDDAVRQILAGLDELPLHPDVVPALEQLHGYGFRLVTLSNGSAAYAERLLARADAAQHVEQFLSVDDVRRWKPAPEVYRHAAERCAVRAEDVMLVAVHPWDTDGAMRAGLSGAWIDRQGSPFPDVFRRPDLVCSSLTELAATLRSGSGGAVPA